MLFKFMVVLFSLHFLILWTGICTTSAEILPKNTQKKMRRLLDAIKAIKVVKPHYTAKKASSDRRKNCPLFLLKNLCFLAALQIALSFYAKIRKK